LGRRIKINEETFDEEKNESKNLMEEIFQVKPIFDFLEDGEKQMKKYWLE
jgi:hypothetical protein